MPGGLCLVAEHLLLSMSMEVECCQMVLCFGGAVVGLLSFSLSGGLQKRGSEAMAPAASFGPPGYPRGLVSPKAVSLVVRRAAQMRAPWFHSPCLQALSICLRFWVLMPGGLCLLAF
jgi:hypothetical protein